MKGKKFSWINETTKSTKINCPRTFLAVRYTKHRRLMNLEINPLRLTEDAPQLDDTRQEELGSQEFCSNHDDTDQLREVEDVEEANQITRAAAIFIMGTMEVHKISQTAMDGIMQKVQTLFTTIRSRLRHDVISTLQEVGIPLSSQQESVIEALLASYQDPFANLHTRYRQDKYIKEHFDYLDPVERVLERGYSQNDKGESVPTSDCCYHIPLIKSLRALLKCTVVHKQIFTNNRSCDGNMRDYCDASAFKTHSLFTSDCNAFQIHLHYDDLELCNPLGSKASIHKIGVFYYTLGNLNASLRSTLSSIQLLAIVKSQFIEQYGIDRVLRPFVEDLKLLEKDCGVSFHVDGSDRQCRGTLVNVSADNPAACVVGGFKQLHTAFRKCRYCMATEEDIQSKFHESQHKMRTRRMHERHCASVTNDGPIAEEEATICGVTRKSILNELKYFNVIDGMAPDIMHDILEGVLPLTIMMVLKYACRKGYLKLDQFNSRITSFCYGPTEVANKPSKMKSISTASETTIKQSASQTWCLGRFLPMLIGDLIPEGDEHWENYLHLMIIIDYIFSPVTNEDVIAYLRILIEDFLTDFRELYPQRRLTPKMHYLIHVPTWMQRCGPLTRMWCMRYESKHTTLKKYSQVVHNFKNIAKSIAYHHQREMCYLMADTKNYLASKEVYGQVKFEQMSTYQYASVLLEGSYGFTESSTINRVRYTTIKGTKYAVGYVIWCFSDEVPVFGCIEDIVTRPAGSLFITKLYKTITFNTHFHAYEVTPTHNELSILRQEELADYHPLQISKSYSVSSPMFIRTKYHIM